MEINCASVANEILSDESNLLIGVVALGRFGPLFGSRSQNDPTPIKLCRFVQELAIFQQGAVVKKLLDNVLRSQENVSEDYNTRMADDCAALFSARILTHLGMSKVVGDFCVQDTRAARGLLSFFVETLEFSKEPHREKAANRSAAFRAAKMRPGTEWVELFSLAGIIYFSRASKLFRESMRKSEQLLPVLQHVLSEEYLKSSSDVPAVRLRIANIIEALSVSQDSQEWMIEMGYLKLVVRVFETRNSTPQEGAQDLCSSYIFKLSELPRCVCLMREKGLYPLLKPHSKVIDSLGFWSLLENNLLGRKRMPGALRKKYKEGWKKDKVDAFESGLPTVCSLSGCFVPSEKFSGAKFSKCSRCHVAHYCSKEHQKAHWPQHKKNCLQPKTN